MMEPAQGKAAGPGRTSAPRENFLGKKLLGPWKARVSPGGIIKTRAQLPAAWGRRGGLGPARAASTMGPRGPVAGAGWRKVCSVGSSTRGPGPQSTRTSGLVQFGIPKLV